MGIEGEDSSEVVPITRDWAEANIDALEDLFRGAVEIPWTRENILLELPGKWQFSFAAVNDGELVSALFSSEKADRVVWVHAQAVKRGERGKGAAQPLYERMAMAASDDGASAIMARIARSNTPSLRYALRNGFHFSALDEANDQVEIRRDLA